METEPALRTVVVQSKDGDGAKVTVGQVQIRFFSSKERTTRALKAWGACWGVAVLGIPLPIIHATLVPLAFLAGIIAPFWVYQMEAMLAGGVIPCPHCSADVKIEKQKYDPKAPKWPRTELCTFCRNDFRYLPAS